MAETNPEVRTERRRVLRNLINALLSGEITPWQAQAALTGLEGIWKE